MITLASLADVIFLLLLYFILTSTFSRFGEMELMSGSAGAAVSPPAADDRAMLFLQLAPGTVTLNGAATLPADLGAAVAALVPEGGQARAILSLRDGVNAQEMTDVLVILRRLPGVDVTVIG